MCWLCQEMNTVTHDQRGDGTFRRTERRDTLKVRSIRTLRNGSSTMAIFQCSIIADERPILWGGYQKAGLVQVIFVSWVVLQCLLVILLGTFPGLLFIYLFLLSGG